MASGLGDRVATLAMNSADHLAAWYGISGIGAVYHTLNPRLFQDQLAYIINHADDRLILADGMLRADSRQAICCRAARVCGAWFS